MRQAVARVGDFDERVRVALAADKCSPQCLAGKTVQLSCFFRSLDHMNAGEKKTSIMTALALLVSVDTAERRRGKGQRTKHSYHLPIAGEVCRGAFCYCYGVSATALTRYKSRISHGKFNYKPHGGISNKNAKSTNMQWLNEWFVQFASEVGDVVPVRVRQQTTVAGITKRYYSSEKFTLLPASFTWERIHDELSSFITTNDLDIATPATSTMRQLLTNSNTKIQIRSPRDNVCDACTIYQNRMISGQNAELNEEFGRHTELHVC